MDCAIKQSTPQFHKIFFHISKCLACYVEKTLQLKITKKELIQIYEYVYIYIYIYIYIPTLYVTRIAQNKKDSLNSILQHGCVVGNNCCVVFPA